MCDIGGRGGVNFLVCDIIKSFMNAPREVVTHVTPRHKGVTERMVPEVFIKYAKYLPT